MSDIINCPKCGVRVDLEETGAFCVRRDPKCGVVTGLKNGEIDRKVVCAATKDE